MRKGSKMTLEQRKKLSIAHLGQKSWNKGRKCPHIWGNKHPNWKGGKDITNSGYIRLQINGNTVLEHRYKMEKHLGRKLKKSEVIHHKNGIKTDNRIENLELIKNNSEHMRLHRWSFGGRKIIKCGNCNKKFSDFKSNKRIFCSKICYTQSQRRINEKIL